MALVDELGAAGCTRYLTLLAQMIHTPLTTRPNRGQNEKSVRGTETGAEGEGARNKNLPQETISIVMSRTSRRTVGHKAPPVMVSAMPAC